MEKSLKIFGATKSAHNFWNVCVYCGETSTATKPIIAVEVESRTIEGVKFAFTLHDFLHNDKLVLSTICNSGFCTKDVLYELRCEVECILSDKLANDEGEIESQDKVIWLDASKGETIDALLNNAQNDHTIDHYHNNLMDSLQTFKRFPCQSDDTATDNSVAVWLDKPLYVKKHKGIYLAVRENKFGELIKWNRSEAMSLSYIKECFVMRDIIYKGNVKTTAMDLTLSRNAKNVRCLVLNITPDILGKEV